MGATTFTKNRDRFLDGDIAAAFFDAVLIHADIDRLLSDEHFTVDATLLEAWASQKSFQPKTRIRRRPREPEGDISTGSAERTRRNQSTRDPDARLYEKARGREAALRISATC